MDSDNRLAPFTIPTPCPIDWDRMTGDDRVRYCKACGKDVYNLTVMTSDEVGALLATIDEGGGDLCGRVYRRPDGTLVDSECPPARPAARGWQFTLKSLMVLIAGVAAMLGFTRWIASATVVVAGGICRRPPGLTASTGSPARSTTGAATTADDCAEDPPAP